jgi:hypothetical protein
LINSQTVLLGIYNTAAVPTSCTQIIGFLALLVTA